MEQIAHHLEEKERTHDIEIDENVTFTDMLLSEPVLAGLHAAGFRRPSPIQLAAIPLGRCGLDLVVQAKSGTGKTCVLAVVVLESVSAASPATQAVVVAPTREVAVQVAQVVSTLASAMSGLSTAAFIGGTKLAEDKAKLKQCQVVVGTPGRLAQLVSLGHLRLQCVRLLVLDEADRLLEGNFFGPVTELAKALPHNKQVLCLSATFSDSAASQAESLMRSPSHIRLDRESPALLGVNQVVRRLPPVTSPHMRQAAKEAELLWLLSHITFNQCLVFSGSQLRAESVCHRLRAEGWPAAHLTAAQCQTERLAALEALCSHKCRILVATDLAARGLDSAHVNLVVSLDLPPDPATYLHRAGRAGRYGSRGAAVMLVCGPEEWYGVRAITTLANVKLLLTGQKWVSHLATKKVEGWRKSGAGKEEEAGVEESVEGKEERVEKQEEEEKEGRKIVVERSEEGEEEKVTRLEEVDHLAEEEARAWLKAHKPYRKDSGRAAPKGREAQEENGVLQMENKKKSVKGDNENSRNGLRSEAKYEFNLQTHKDHEVSKKKVRKKKQPHTEASNHRNDGGQREEEEEKENRGENCEKKHRHTYKHMNGDRKNQADTLKHKQEQENDTDTQEIKAEKDLDTKASVMSLVSRLWHRPPPVTMSYSRLLSECTAQYSTSSPTPDTHVKVPPWPVQVEASEGELNALEKYLDGMQGEARKRKQVQDGVRFDALAVLQAVTEGKDGRKVLEEVIQQASSVLSPHTPSSSSTPQSMHSDPLSSSSTPEHPAYSLPKDYKQLSSSSSEQKHKTSSSPDSEDVSSSSSDTKPSSTRQKHISSSYDHKQPSRSTEHTKHLSFTLSQAMPHPQMVEPPHSATGARPKQARKQKQGWHSKESATYDPTHYQEYQYDNQNNQAYNGNYQGYSQWYPGYDESYQDYNQAYADYNQEYHDYNQTYQTYDQGQNYDPGYQGFYNQAYQGYNQGHQGYNQGHGCHQYAMPTSHLHTPHGYTYGLQADAYMKSACKFASMMEYVSTMGRVSLHVAQDYHSRRKQRHKQQ